MAYIEVTPYRDPNAWGRPNPNPRPHLTLEEWARRNLSTYTRKASQ
jgi:hypothetical protein